MCSSDLDTIHLHVYDNFIPWGDRVEILASFTRSACSCFPEQDMSQRTSDVRDLFFLRACSKVLKTVYSHYLAAPDHCPERLSLFFKLFTVLLFHRSISIWFMLYNTSLRRGTCASLSRRQRAKSGTVTNLPGGCLSRKKKIFLCKYFFI